MSNDSDVPGNDLISESIMMHSIFAYVISAIDWEAVIKE